MELYFIFIFILFLFLFLSKIKDFYNVKYAINNQVDFIFIVAFVFVFILVSIRYDVGWDYIHYYNSVFRNDNNNITGNGELLTIFFVEVGRYIKSPLFYFFINALIFYFSLFIFIRKYSTDKWLSFFIFICFPLFFLNSLSVVRTFTAIALILYAYDFLISKKIVFYLIIVFLASLFHKAALVGLFFVFFAGLRISSYIWFVLLCVSPFVTGLLTPLLEFILPKYSVYFEVTEAVEGTKAIYFFVIFAFYMILFRKKLIGNSYTNLVFYNIYMFGVCIYLAFMDFGTMGHRLSLYGTITSVVLIPIFISRIKQQRLKLFLNISLYVFLVGIFLLAVNVGREAYIPYTTIF